MELSGRFIKATNDYSTLEHHVPAPCFRKVFRRKENIETATLKIAALGFYRLFINGTEITSGVLAPYISAPDHFVCVDTYDVSGLIVRGENAIAVMLGNGFMNNPGGYVWDFDKLPWRGAPAFALGLTITDNTHQEDTLHSNASFRWKPSAILFDDIRKGEICDARKRLKGWTEAGYDDEDWQSVTETEDPHGELIPRSSGAVLIKEERRSVSVRPVDDGYLFDFGLNDSGVCRLRLRGGRKGQEIRMYHGEHLIGGRLDRKNITCDKTTEHQLDIFISAGEAEEVYTPSFTYHGFRYVYVTGLTKDQLAKDTLTYLVYRPDFKEVGSFASSEKTVNQLEEITIRSALSNFIHIPTDCPQREKNGWTADAALACEMILTHFDAKENYRLWLKSLRMAQREDGALPGIAPSGGWGFGDLRGPAWDCAIVTVPYTIYKYTKDSTILAENAHAIFRYLGYLTTQTDAEGLIYDGLGDWCQTDRSSASDCTAPLEFTNTVMALDSCDKAAEIFGVLHMELQQRFAKDLYARLMRAARKHLIDENAMIAKGNCQTSQAMAIYYKVFRPEEYPMALLHLLKLIYEKDTHMDVGVLGAKVLFHVLSSFGYTELALKMITRSDFPSYGNWLKKGATTLGEDFSRDEVHVASLNHIFWGDISYFFLHTLAGIGYSAFEGGGSARVAPQFPDGLRTAKGSLRTPEGELTVSWERKGAEVLLQVDADADVRGEITLPDDWKFADERDTKALIGGRWTLHKVQKVKMPVPA